GQRVAAVVVAADPARPPALAALQSAVRERVAAYAAPRALAVVAAIPLLPSGKPDPAALRDLAGKATLAGEAG
ncbi:MAG: hypothetical protein J2P34_10605, partial [Actinobacteria bacterium]|nr:hypothetical protein [Actinomycetota bacterium]